MDALRPPTMDIFMKRSRIEVQTSLSYISDEEDDAPLLLHTEKGDKKILNGDSEQDEPRSGRGKLKVTATIIMATGTLLLLLKSGLVLTEAARLQYVGTVASSDENNASFVPLLTAFVPYSACQLIIGALAIVSRDWTHDDRPCCFHFATFGRWILGFICVVAISSYKTAVLLPTFELRPVDSGSSTSLQEDEATKAAAREASGWRLFIYVTTALWECSNAAILFGGRKLQDRFGISGYKQALIAALLPCQVKFVHIDLEECKDVTHERNKILDECLRFLKIFPSGKSNDSKNVEHMRRQLKHRIQRSVSRSVHLSIGIFAGLTIRWLLRDSGGFLAIALSSNAVLEAITFATLASCFVLFCDLPSFIASVFLDILVLSREVLYSTRERNDDAAQTDIGSCSSLLANFYGSDYFQNLAELHVILPYGNVLCSRSSREFWGRWSRPASQLIRQMIYYPLRSCTPKVVSIILLFALNSTSHYDVGAALNGTGDRSEGSWNIAFAVLGFAAILEVVTTDILAAHYFKGENAISNDSNSTSYDKTRYISMQLPLSYRIFIWFVTQACLLYAVRIVAKECLKFDLRTI